MKNIKNDSLSKSKGKVVDVYKDRLIITCMPDFFHIDIRGLDLKGAKAIDVSFEDLRSVQDDLDKLMGKEDIIKIDKTSNIEIGKKFKAQIEVICSNCNSKETIEVNKDSFNNSKFICKNCETKQQLIEKAKTKGIHQRISYDCHLNTEIDDVMTPDKDGDSLFKHTDLELCNFEGVRLQFAHNANVTDVLRAIDKIKSWITQEANISFRDRNKIEDDIEANND